MADTQQPDPPRRGAFASNDGMPRTQAATVAFVDFLGFSRQLRQAAQESREDELLRQVHNFLSSWRTALLDRYSQWRDQRRSWEIKFFTDNIVIAHPIRTHGDPEMGSLLGSLALFQIDAASERFFLRGGLAFGPFYMDEDVVFGIPLLDAYETEKHTARWPRVVLSASARQFIAERVGTLEQARGSAYYQHIIQDEDGEWFINYLDSCFHDYTEPPEFAWIERHRDAIVERLERYRGDAEVLPKYEWAARYHNFWCSSWHLDRYEIAGHLPLQAKRLSESLIAG